MRLLALVLLLANVAFVAWAMYAPESGTLESQLIAQQMRAEAIHLLSDQQVAALAAKKKADAPKTAACLEWGPFNAADVVRARGLLEQSSPAATVSERHSEDGAGWWVFMPPQPTRQGANLKVAELKRLGVDDYFVVQEDPKLRFAISLGIFRSEDAARNRLEDLRGRGVRTAQVGRRQTPVQRIYLQIREPGDFLQSRMGEVRDDYPGSDVKECGS